MEASSSHTNATEVATIRSLEGLRDADVRLASIFFRLARGNVALCDRRRMQSGLVLHALSSYSAGVKGVARRYFDFASPVAVAGVVEGSPATVADIQSNDSLVAVDGQDLTGAPIDIDALDERIASRSPGVGIELGLVRQGRQLVRRLVPVGGCVGRVEVRVTAALSAATDGTTIQVSTGLMNVLVSDNDLAEIVAHELAHIILRHPERLTAARVNRGLLRDFGRNARLIRRTEVEADRLSVCLLANAGYDPVAASHYLKAYGDRLGANGLFVGTTHPRGEARIILLDAEAAKLAELKTRTVVPDWLESRTEPLR